MKCSICNAARLSEGHVTLTFERAGKTIVVKGVPGHICPDCGEEYVSDETAARALDTAQHAAAGDEEIAVLHYRAA